MKSSAKIALAAGAAVLAGVLLIAGLRRQAADPVPAVQPAPVATETAPMELQPQAPADSAPAPWQSGDPAQAGAPAAATANPPAFPSRPAMPAAGAQLSLQQMDQQLAQNEAQAQALLRQLDMAAATGSLPANVNIEAARTNIQVALKAQRLGREMAMLIQQPDSPQRQSRMARINGELNTLRNQLRYDISNTASPAPAQAAPR